MVNYITRKGGQAVSNQLPLQVDDVNQASDKVTYSAETVTFASAAAAASPGVNALDHGPILNLTGDKVGSYWGEDQNRMMTYQNQVGTLLGAVTETAGSASIVITDVNNALDTLYETTSGNRRYILKLTDIEGDVLYGWIGNITVSGNAYTIPVHDAVTSGNQDWKGTLADFTTVQRAEIFSYQSSFVWVTGTVLTREVALDEEAVQTAEGQRKYFAGLSNGDYGVNYRTGAIYFKKATTGTSDTCNYDSIAAPSVLVTSSGAASTLVDDAAFTVGTSIVTPIGFLADETATDSVDEGDIGAPRMTLNRRQITASEFIDDTAHATTDYVSALGGRFDDVTPDSVDEGDIGIVRMSGRRELYSQIRDAAGNERGLNVDTNGEIGIGAIRTSVTPGTAAGNLGKAIDSAVGGTDTGVAALVRRTDSLVGLTPADGDYTVLNVDNQGVLWTRISSPAGLSATKTDDSAYSIASDSVFPSGFLADETATDSVDEGDIGLPRMTLNRRVIGATNFLDDGAYAVGTDYVNATGFMVDETATDSADEGDIGIARMSADRKQLIAGSYLDDVAITPAGVNTYGVLIGAIADETGPDSVDEGDFGGLRMTLTRFLKTSMGDQLSGEDQTNTVFQVVEKPLAVATYTPDADTSAAAEKSSVSKASAGNLYGFSATNSNAAVRYVQFFNSTTVPADATVPVLEFIVPANGGVSGEWPKGRAFTTGIAWCFSTTSQTKTIITAANDALVDVQYK